MAKAQLPQLRNLGPASWRMLAQAGIHDVDTLRRIGAAAAFADVEQARGGASLNLLYAMAAGLEGRHWCDLDSEEKGRLLREVEEIRDLHESATRDMHSRPPDRSAK